MKPAIVAISAKTESSFSGSTFLSAAISSFNKSSGVSFICSLQVSRFYRRRRFYAAVPAFVISAAALSNAVFFVYD
jgi:hypothetical protein